MSDVSYNYSYGHALSYLTAGYECTWPHHEWSVEENLLDRIQSKVTIVLRVWEGFGLERKFDSSRETFSPDFNDPSVFVDQLNDAIERVGLRFRKSYKVDTGPAREFRIFTRGRNRLKARAST